MSKPMITNTTTFATQLDKNGRPTGVLLTYRWQTDNGLLIVGDSAHARSVLTTMFMSSAFDSAYMIAVCSLNPSEFAWCQHNIPQRLWADNTSAINRVVHRVYEEQCNRLTLLADYQVGDVNHLPADVQDALSPIVLVCDTITMWQPTTPSKQQTLLYQDTMRTLATIMSTAATTGVRLICTMQSTVEQTRMLNMLTRLFNSLILLDDTTSDYNTFSLHPVFPDQLNQTLATNPHITGMAALNRTQFALFEIPNSIR